MDGLEPIHEAQERDRKDPFLQRVVPLEPNPDHHRTNDSPAKELTAGRSVRKRAPVPRKLSRSRLKGPLAPQRRSVALRRFLRALNKMPKRRLEIFHAIGRQSVVRGKVAKP